MILLCSQLYVESNSFFFATDISNVSKVLFKNEATSYHLFNVKAHQFSVVNWTVLLRRDLSLSQFLPVILALVQS